MDRYRLVIPLRQTVDGLVHRTDSQIRLYPGVELHAAAVLPLQMLLHLVGQVLRDVAPPAEHQAVQPHAVVEQVPGVVVEAGLQAAVAHHHPVDDLQLPIDLPEMLHRVLVPHPTGHGIGPRLGRKDVQVRVNDLHKSLL